MTLTEAHRRTTASPAVRRSLRYLPFTAFALDVAVVVGSSIVAIVMRSHVPLFNAPTDVSGTLDVAGPLIGLGWLASLLTLGAYRQNVFGSGADEYRRIASGTLAAASLTGVGCYLAKFSLSRGYFVLLFGLGLAALILGRYALRRALHAARRHGHIRQTAVIVGSHRHVDEIHSVLRREAWLGYEVLGAVTPPGDPRSVTTGGLGVLGSTSHLVATVADLNAEVVFFAGGGLGSGQELRELVWELELADAHVVVAPSLLDVSAERLQVRPVGGLPLIHLDKPRWTEASNWGKRAFDIVGSSALIFMLLPVFCAIALSIKLHDRGPVFFGHNRIGRNEESFKCLKFRTMVINAESLVEELQAQTGQQALLFKMVDDPRITKPGKWLRRFSLDEFPQLINVLRGDMSLVGPRPQVAAEVELYDDHMRRRLHVRPGMTGLWQISGRNDLTPEEAMRLDLYYVDNWSMFFDLSILARTVTAVAASRGAY